MELRQTSGLRRSLEEFFFYHALSGLKQASVIYMIPYLAIACFCRMFLPYVFASVLYSLFSLVSMRTVSGFFMLMNLCSYISPCLPAFLITHVACRLHTYTGTVLPFHNTASKNAETRPMISSVGPIVQKHLDIR